jgi:hypothetical protein
MEIPFLIYEFSVFMQQIAFLTLDIPVFIFSCISSLSPFLSSQNLHLAFIIVLTLIVFQSEVVGCVSTLITWRTKGYFPSGCCLLTSTAGLMLPGAYASTNTALSGQDMQSPERKSVKVIIPK